MKQFYLFITFMLFITARPTLAQNCNDLEILTTTNGSVYGEGSVTLSATASGTGDDIFWYDAATGGNWVGSGATYVTPPLTAPTSYWATEIIGSGSSGSVGPTGPTAVGTITSYGTDFYYTEFTVKQATVLISVDVFIDPVVAIGTSSSISIEDTNGNLIQNIPYTTSVSGNSTPQTVALNVPLSPGDYRMKQGSDYITLYRNTTGASYPYTSPEIDITGNNFDVNYYYFFYNFQFSTLVVTCESPRVEVLATLNNQADEEILTLPYTHTASTFDYDNNYSGAPGTDCGTTESYLDGYDVVYKYTADDDYKLNNELSGLTDSHTDDCIYESCMHIGNTWHAKVS